MTALSVGPVLFQTLKQLSGRGGGIELKLIDKAPNVSITYIADYPKGRVTPFVVGILPSQVLLAGHIPSPERFMRLQPKVILPCSIQEREGFVHYETH